MWELEEIRIERLDIDSVALELRLGQTSTSCGTGIDRYS